MTDTAATRKPGLSQRLMGMKFMQKAKAREAQAQEGAATKEDAPGSSVPAERVSSEPTEQANPAKPEHNSGEPAPRCTIIYDRTPLPAGISQGRRSFGPKAAEEAGDGPGAATAAASGKDVTDVEMAKKIFNALSPSSGNKDRSGSSSKDRPKPSQEGEYASLRDRKRNRKG